MLDNLSPSAIIVGALLAGFALYLAKSNRLATYYGFLFGGGSSSGSSSPSYLIPPVPWLGFPGVTK